MFGQNKERLDVFEVKIEKSQQPPGIKLRTPALCSAAELR